MEQFDSVTLTHLADRSNRGSPRGPDAVAKGAKAMLRRRRTRRRSVAMVIAVLFAGSLSVYALTRSPNPQVVVASDPPPEWANALEVHGAGRVTSVHHAFERWWVGVSDPEGSRLEVFDDASGSPVASLQLPAEPYAIDHTSERLLVRVTTGGIGMLDTDTDNAVVPVDPATTKAEEMLGFDGDGGIVTDRAGALIDDQVGLVVTDARGVPVVRRAYLDILADLPGWPAAAPAAIGMTSDRIRLTGADGGSVDLQRTNLQVLDTAPPPALPGEPRSVAAAGTTSVVTVLDGSRTKWWEIRPGAAPRPIVELEGDRPTIDVEAGYLLIRDAESAAVLLVEIETGTTRLWQTLPANGDARLLRSDDRGVAIAVIVPSTDPSSGKPSTRVRIVEP